jgi:hypothetical protein
MDAVRAKSKYRINLGTVAERQTRDTATITMYANECFEIYSVHAPGSYSKYRMDGRTPREALCAAFNDETDGPSDAAIPDRIVKRNAYLLQVSTEDRILELTEPWAHDFYVYLQKCGVPPELSLRLAQTHMGMTDSWRQKAREIFPDAVSADMRAFFVSKCQSGMEECRADQAARGLMARSNRNV